METQGRRILRVASRGSREPENITVRRPVDPPAADSGIEVRSPGRPAPYVIDRARLTIRRRISSNATPHDAPNNAPIPVEPSVPQEEGSINDGDEYYSIGSPVQEALVAPGGPRLDPERSPINLEDYAARARRITDRIRNLPEWNNGESRQTVIPPDGSDEVRNHRRIVRVNRRNDAVAEIPPTPEPRREPVANRRSILRARREDSPVLGPHQVARMRGASNDRNPHVRPLIARGPRPVTQTIDLSASPRNDTPMSISSASSENTLSSESEASDPYEGWADPIGEILDLAFAIGRREEARATPELAASRMVETGLLNQPHIFNIIKTHSGRVKCQVCDARITRDQLRIDYRPTYRTAAVKHCHQGCLARNRNMFFPDRGRDLVSFGDDFNEVEKEALIVELRASLMSETTARERNVRMFPVVRHGDAHERRVQEINDQSNYMRARHMVRPLFQQTFVSEMPQPVHRGLSRHLLEALPRVDITPVESDEEEHTCVVCLEPMLSGQNIMMLPCFHKYHAACISEWLKNSKQCPIDKLDIDVLLRESGHSQAIPSGLG